MEILLQLRNLFKSPKMEYNINSVNYSNMDINITFIIKMIIFLISRKRTKMILYFHDIDNCNKIRKILNKLKINIGIVTDINKDRKTYKARMILLKEYTYEELINRAATLIKHNMV